MFVDDSLVFCKATSTACNKLKNFLDDFCLMLGLLANFHKSALALSKKIRNARKSSLASLFNMTPKACLGRYLGVFFSSYYPTKRDYSHTLLSKEFNIGNLVFSLKLVVIPLFNLIWKLFQLILAPHL